MCVVLGMNTTDSPANAGGDFAKTVRSYEPCSKLLKWDYIGNYIGDYYKGFLSGILGV